MTTTTTTSRDLQRLPIDGAHMVLTAARDAGLPTPGSVVITKSRLHVNVQHDEADQWLTWVDAGEPRLLGTRSSYATGEKYDLRVTVGWDSPAQTCTHCGGVA